MSVLITTTRISHQWLERKPKHELASIILANIDKIDLFADENRTREAALEAALKRGIQGLRNLLEFRATGNGRYGNLTREEVEESIAEAEAALSGGTAALDAAIAEATRELREERDALAAALAELPDKVRGEMLQWVTRRGHDPRSAIGDWTLDLADTIKSDIENAAILAQETIAARDARVRAEALEHLAEEDDEAISRMTNPRAAAAVLRECVAELRKLAAQAGEGDNAE